jgi:hypothetical protein
VFREDLPPGIPLRLLSFFEERPVPVTPPVRISPWSDLVEANQAVAMAIVMAQSSDEDSGSEDAMTLREWGPAPDFPALSLANHVPPPRPLYRPQAKAAPVPRATRLRARQLEELDPPMNFVYKNIQVTWMFSTRFWEVVLIAVDSLVMVDRGWQGQELLIPAAPTGYRAVWRHVGNSANRRWGIFRDPTAGTAVAISRIGAREDL